MNKSVLLALFLFSTVVSQAQLVEVQANYNNVGDVEFVAYNNSGAPLFLRLDFADLENTVFREPLPYIKLLETGFNILFTLLREPDAEVPRFNYQIKVFRSNPMALADLDFPYLIPLAEGREAEVFEVDGIDGFWGKEEPASWNATGFRVQSNEPVFASRTGIIVEIVGPQRVGDPQTWYHTWNNSVTVLQSDGTLLCYRNAVDRDQNLKSGEKIFAGQQIGIVAPGSTDLILLIYQHSLNSADLRFVIPRFVTGEKDTDILLPKQKYKVFHPMGVRGIEMTSREKRRYLK